MLLGRKHTMHVGEALAGEKAGGLVLVDVARTPSGRAASRPVHGTCPSASCRQTAPSHSSARALLGLLNDVSAAHARRLGCASNLIGDEDAGVAAVVDPKLNVVLNRGPLVKETVESHPLSPRQVQQAQEDRALVQALGGKQVIHVVEGGPPLWKRQGWPTEQSEKA
jgi:hypothetical protein